MLIEALSVSECGNFICFYLIILHIVFYSAVICSIYYTEVLFMLPVKIIHGNSVIIDAQWTLHDKSSYRYNAFYMWQICVCLYSYTLSHLINNGASIILSYIYIFSLWFLWVCKFVVYSRLSIDRIFVPLLFKGTNLKIQMVVKHRCHQEVLWICQFWCLTVSMQGYIHELFGTFFIFI